MAQARAAVQYEKGAADPHQGDTNPFLRTTFLGLIGIIRLGDADGNALRQDANARTRWIKAAFGDG